MNLQRKVKIYDQNKERVKRSISSIIPNEIEFVAYDNAPPLNSLILLKPEEANLEIHDYRS